ncbi:DinB family protein [Fulvivirga sp. 29W222]|uniref:DinB family protein n=1 Tax=Fulvivirga marina TaxID=2494733 RepID=A0A937KGK9_9BACT|nr:DinB family protein [Fulvivirga marina]MBL6449525.1 DinB family protein [Fulvivirga marina]
MEFNLKQSTEILSKTPAILSTWLSDLPPDWTHKNEGEDTWSAFDIVGHLIHGERTDWIARTRLIIEKGEDKPFEPFDRFAQFNSSKGKSLKDLLQEFEKLRSENLRILSTLPVAKNLNKKGRHPALGTVTLKQLLATWVVHDLNHLHQMSRVMAFQYRYEVGVWREYLGVIK